MSRLLLALLPVLLAACSLLPVPPPPPPPYPEQAEALYYALLTQEVVRHNWAEAAAGNMQDGDAFAMVVWTVALLKASDHALAVDYADVYVTYAAHAKTQGRALQDIGRRWLDTRELAPADVPAALNAIDTNGELLRYSNYLLSLGYSHDDVEMMNVRFKKVLAPN